MREIAVTREPVTLAAIEFILRAPRVGEPVPADLPTMRGDGQMVRADGTIAPRMERAEAIAWLAETRAQKAAGIEPITPEEFLARKAICA